MKRCRKCGETKPRSEFHKNRAHKDGLQSYCKPCQMEAVNVWRREHPEKTRVWSDRWRFRRSMKVDVVATTEAEVLAALAQPRPFYAELTQ